MTRELNDRQSRRNGPPCRTPHPKRVNRAERMPMGRIEFDDAVSATTRRLTAKAVQQAVASARADAEMFNQRRTLMRLADRVFGGSIVKCRETLPRGGPAAHVQPKILRDLRQPILPLAPSALARAAPMVHSQNILLGLAAPNSA